MDIKALQFAARFSLTPNSLGYCGGKQAGEKLTKCIQSGICSGVDKELSNFIVLHPYLQTISKISGLSAYSYSVVESYWLGNDLLKKAETKDYNLLLKNFKKQKIPDFLINELRQKKPEKFIPNHLFQVLHIGVGKASGSVPFNIKTINNCMIRWGEIKQIKGNKTLINLSSLKIFRGGYKLTSQKEWIPFDLSLIPGLKSGDFVAVHWKQVIKILNKGEIKKIDYWTKEVLKSFK
jgi:hypothetical protein